MSKSLRVYSEDELALFARYEPERAKYRPAGCNEGAGCWVKCGPPGLKAGGDPRCIACSKRPRISQVDRSPKYKRPLTPALPRR